MLHLKNQIVMNPTSEEIKKQEIVDQLAWNDSVNANDVTVTVKGNTVMLEGSVPTYAAKKAAEEEAYLVGGITSVENMLEVVFPPEFTLPTDEEIKSNVEVRLLWNNQINASKIIVETDEGFVTLSGEVESYWEKILAEDIATSTQGVVGVINKLLVMPRKTSIDIDIENDIKKAYQRSALVDENAIEVSVKDGVVRLTGEVPFFVMKKEALDIAFYTSGVIDIVDDISIGV